jgi:hypothetical protein
MTNFHRACAPLYRAAALGLFAIFFWLPAAHAVPFSSAGGIGAPGGPVSIVIEASGLVGLESATFDLTFDPGVLEFVAASEADPAYLGDGFPILLDPGYLLLSVFAPVVDGDGDLVRLAFNVRAGAPLGPTTLDFACLSLCEAPDYVFDAFSATIMVAQDTSQPVPAPETALLLLAGLGGLLAVRRRGLSAKGHVVR